MTRYAVFVCPRCRNAFSKEAKVKRTRCPRCDAPLKPDNLFPIISTDDPALAAEGVRHVNLNNLGGEDAEAIKKSILETKRKANIPTGRYETLLRRMKKGKEYTADELSEVMEDAAEAFLAAAMKRGDVYEPTPGRYRRLE